MGKDIQRALLWVILFTACFMLWDNYQVSHGGTSFFQPAEQVEAPKSEANNVPVSNALQQAEGAAEKIELKDPVVIHTDRLQVTFDREGAVIVGNTLLNYPNQPEWTDVGLAGLILGNKKPENLRYVLLIGYGAERTYVAQTGLVGGDLPNHRDVFKLVSSKLDMGDADKLDVVFEAEKNGVTVRKTYEFTRGNYGVKLTTDVVNNSDKEITPSIYYQITRDGGKADGGNSMSSTYTGPAFYTEAEKFQKVKFEAIADGDAKFEKHADNGWVAMVQHHFVTAWVPTEGEQRENYVRELSKDLYTIGSIVPLKAIAPGASESTSAVLYSGPQDQNHLEQIAKGLDLVVDYGWLTFLAKPIYWLLSLLHGFVGNWGWAIVLLTVIVKAILFPISAAGYRSMARMKEVTPRMKALQDKYKDDKQRLNQAMMELYRTEKINPLGGCLPILLQIPVFLALYWVLQGSVELRDAPWILWVHDLAAPDPWFILPAIMAVTMFLQIFLNPKPTDPVQAKVMYVMPVVFSVMFFIFASGLVLYWLTNNVLSIAQQWYINRTIAAERANRLKS